jgi:hypothetical protein
LPACRELIGYDPETGAFSSFVYLNLLKAGYSVKIAQAQAGHSSAGFTLDRYGHMTPMQAEQVVKEAVGQILVTQVCY